MKTSLIQNNFADSNFFFFFNFSSETALTWFAMDFTDDSNGRLEKLAVKFKLAATKEEFKEAFETAQTKLKTADIIVERAKPIQVCTA